MQEQDYLLIEKYINGEASESERLEVSKRRVNDAIFANAFEQHQLLLEVVDEMHENHLKKLLQDKEVEVSAKNSKPQNNNNIRSFNYKKWFAIAASILVLVVSAYILINNTQQNQSTKEAFFTQNFEPYRNFLIPVERSQPTTNQLEKAFQNYENGNYEAAIIGFDNYLQDSLSADILFYKGVAELAEEQTGNAVKNFEQSLDLDTQFEEEASWYLILANFKLGKMKLVQKQSDAFQNNFPNSIYNEKIKVFNSIKLDFIN